MIDVSVLDIKYALAEKNNLQVSSRAGGLSNVRQMLSFEITVYVPENAQPNESLDMLWKNLDAEAMQRNGDLSVAVLG